MEIQTDHGPITRLPFYSIEDIKRANSLAGKFFFSPDTMRFFRSRVCGDIEPLPNGGALFITSEQFEFRGDRHVRKYTIRMAQPDGDCATIGDFQAYETRALAIGMMRRIAKWAAR